MCRLLDYARYECKSGANRDNADLSAVSVAEKTGAARPTNAGRVNR